jgi:hypothetical protein
VTATLLDRTGKPQHLPVYFNATVGVTDVDPVIRIGRMLGLEPAEEEACLELLADTGQIGLRQKKCRVRQVLQSTRARTRMPLAT